MKFLLWLQGLTPFLLTSKRIAPEKQEILVSSTLFIGIFVFSIFAIINYLSGFYLLAILQVFLFAVYLSCFLTPNSKLSMQAKGSIAIMGTITLLWFLYVIGGIEDSGIYWMPILPFIVFTMSGIKVGWRWLTLFVAGLAGLQVIHSLGMCDIAYSFGQTIQFLTAFLVYTILAFIFEVLRIQSWDELQEKNLQLEQIRGTLSDTLDNLEKEVESRTSEIKESHRQLQLEIKHHKETNYALRETEQKFYQAQKMESLGALVGGLAHDFNNTLSGISANLFFIQREIKGNAAVQSKLDDVEKLVFHASEMSKQLLTFARKDKVDKKKFDMCSFMNEAFKLGLSSLPSRIKVDKKLCGEEILPIMGNATQLQQVTLNLLNNARDAVSQVENPVVKVKMMSLQRAQGLRTAHPSLEGDWLYLSVQDNGCGIKEEDIDQVFEPFFTTKAAGKGTGLGLAMCYGAIQSHGGLIEVDSKLNEGTSFHIYLPLYQSAATRMQNEAEPGLLGNGETILIIDDDEGLRVAHQTVLEKMNYHVLQAGSGHEGIKMYAEHVDRVDVVVLDTVISDMTGFKAAQYILDINKGAKIIFISGYDLDATTERWLKQDAKHLGTIKRLQKPFTINALCQALRGALG